MMPAVHADTNRQREPGLKQVTFEQNAGKLGAAAEHIIGPFQRKSRA
jgi:hypothetical protein